MITATIVSGAVFTFCYIATMVKSAAKNENDMKIRNHQITTEATQELKLKELELRNKEVDNSHEQAMAKLNGVTLDLRKIGEDAARQRQLPPMNGSRTKTE